MRPQRLLFEGTSTDKYCAMSTVEFCIGVSFVAVLASAVIRNVGISVLNANLSGKAQRAAATVAERARVQVEMGCRVQTRRLHPSQSPSVL